MQLILAILIFSAYFSVLSRNSATISRRFLRPFIYFSVSTDSEQ
jgi:hypothetical protein